MDGEKAKPGSSVHGTTFKLSLSNWETWMIFTSDSVSLKMTSRRQVQVREWPMVLMRPSKNLVGRLLSVPCPQDTGRNTEKERSWDEVESNAGIIEILVKHRQSIRASELASEPKTIDALRPRESFAQQVTSGNVASCRRTRDEKVAAVAQNRSCCVVQAWGRCGYS